MFERVIMGSIYLLMLIFGLLWIIAGISYLYDRNSPNAFKKKVLLSPLQAGILFIIIGILNIISIFFL